MKSMMYCVLSFQQNQDNSVSMLATACVVNPDGTFMNFAQNGVQVVGAAGVALRYRQSAEDVKDAIVTAFIEGYSLTSLNVDVVFLPEL